MDLYGHAAIIGAYGFRFLRALSSVGDSPLPLEMSQLPSETNRDVSNSKGGHLGSQSSGYNSPHRSVCLSRSYGYVKGKGFDEIHVLVLQAARLGFRASGLLTASVTQKTHPRHSGGRAPR